MTTLEKVSVAASIVCMVKFIVEGVSFYAYGHPVSLGHTDPVAYTAFLGPLWGGHAYINRNPSKKVDNPDAV